MAAGVPQPTISAGEGTLSIIAPFDHSMFLPTDLRELKLLSEAGMSESVSVATVSTTMALTSFAGGFQGGLQWVSVVSVLLPDPSASITRTTGKRPHWIFHGPPLTTTTVATSTVTVTTTTTAITITTGMPDRNLDPTTNNVDSLGYHFTPSAVTEDSHSGHRRPTPRHLHTKH